MPKVFVLLAVIVGAAVSLVTAASPSEAVPLELLGGALGSAVGWAGGFFIARTMATAWDLHSPDQRDILRLASLAVAVPAGASLSVLAVGSWQGVDGNGLLCAGGALLGMVVGMAVEPVLGWLVSALSPSGTAPSGVLGTALEAVGFAAMVVAPAIGATVGFNVEAREH